MTATTAEALHVEHDHRGSWLPTGHMIAARFTELRKRRGVMIALAGVTVGIPTVFLAIRLVLHALSPKTYGPAGGYSVFVGLVVLILYVFGFIVAATLGATAGSVDLTEGMFRHHVVTGRSRVALYLARIPAGLGIVVPLVAIGFAIVCVVCVAAAPAPASFNYNGVTIPMGLSRPQLDRWASDHADLVIGQFPFRVEPGHPRSVDLTCWPADALGARPPSNGPGARLAQLPTCTPAQLRALAVRIADVDYADYSSIFLSPPVGLMVKTGLWIELEAAVGFLVGLGLASLLGQRTIAVILMVILEIVVTPIAAHANLPHMLNLQRGVVGIAMAHLEPATLPGAFGGGSNGGPPIVPESVLVAALVVAGWVVVWSALGAWRMARRDA